MGSTIQDAWGRPLICSECPARLVHGKRAGRPRVTCSEACYQRRHSRREKDRARLKLISVRCGDCGESSLVPHRRACRENSAAIS